MRHVFLKYKILIVVIIVSLLASCLTRTVSLREGIHSFRVQDYRAAFVRLKPLAEKGLPDAQYAVGYMYYYGKGVVEDRKKAWFWITAAAHAQQPDALVAIQILDGKMNTK